MAWIIAIIVGGIIGWLASLVMNRDASMGIFWNIVVGIVGSFIGRFIGSLIGVGATLTEFSVPGLLMSLLGAIVLLLRVSGNGLWRRRDIRPAMGAPGRGRDCPARTTGLPPNAKILR